MINKTGFISLLLCLILALTACGDVTTTSTDPSASSEIAADTTVFPSVPSEEATEPDAMDRDAELRGSWEGDVYTNRILGLQIALPDGFLRFNDYQLAQNNSLLTETYLKTDAAELVQANGHLTIMTMTDYKGSSINLILLPANHEMDGLSDEEIFSLMIKQGSYDEAVTSIESLQMQLDGREKTVLHMTRQENGAEIENYQLWFRGDETFMGVLTIFQPKGMDLGVILEGASLLEPAP